MSGSMPKATVSLVIGAGILFYFYGGGLEMDTKREMKNINDQVASDAVEQYEISKSGGDKIEVCVHAGMVSAAYLQAKDESSYTKWKDIERQDCRLAGIEK